MVFTKKLCPPERRKALIAIRAMPSSPTISISNRVQGEDCQDFRLHISLSIAESSRPGQAITICTNGSVFQSAESDADLDTLAKGTVGLVSTFYPARRINLGLFRVHTARRETAPPLDLKERPETRLLTIPADGQVEVTHGLSLRRIFQYEFQLTPEDVEGEAWRLKLSEGHMGTSWWCWGDLEKDLRDKRLSAWREGMGEEIMAKPKVDENWILGYDPLELVFEDRSELATFQFVA